MKKTYYVITTAIDYVNNLPHIGTAYEKIGADVLARFTRLQGKPVFFVMGNDEHSMNVKREALARGLSPLAYCDVMAERFKEIWNNLDISYDDFIRTTEERHAKAISKLFHRIYEAGDIYPGKYRGLYCESCEAFYREKDLTDGRCPQHGTQPTWVEEDNYFFALSNYAAPLETLLQNNETFILPLIRRNEILGILRSGLEDISISRSTFDWGVPLPIDPSHVVYVWFDALINYISVLGYGWDDDRFEKCWPADIHVIGKDITRFHCLIWPAMLMSAGLEMPRMIFGHGFVHLKGEKMSKTLGNVITPMDIVHAYGPDPLRYYLLRETSFGRDGNFTWDNFIERYNRDLANDLGNLLNRAVNMIQRYRGGKIPAPHLTQPEDEALRVDCEGILSALQEFLDPTNGDINFHSALARIWETVNHANRYVDRTAPWHLNKTGQDDRLDTVLYCAAECLRIISVALSPFLPRTAERITEQLGLQKPEIPAPIHEGVRWGQLTPHTAVLQPLPMFPRIEPDGQEGTPPEIPTTKTTGVEPISIEEFKKLDLRVGRILNAEPIPGSKKLLKLTVDIGELRTLVAGIGKSYTPDALRNKGVVVVANLNPVKLKGVLSEGMILAAGHEDELSLLTMDKEVTPGESIK